VGYAVMMPENDVTRWYKELLAEDGLSLASFKHQHKWVCRAGVSSLRADSLKAFTCRVLIKYQ
jgi:hypothetical protein